MNTILIIHLFSTLFMAGLCWFVQIVHYPLFRLIKLEDFPQYERKNFRTIFITAPVMTIELATGLYLLYFDANILYALNVILMALITLSTALFQIPIHLKLSQMATTPLIDKLIRTNWIRTVSWTVRAVVLGVLLSKSLI